MENQPEPDQLDVPATYARQVPLAPSVAVPSEQAPQQMPQGFDYIPMPLIIKAFMAGLALVFVLAMFRLSGSVSSAVDYELAERDLAQNAPDKAIARLEVAAKSFPDDANLQIELASAYFLNHQYLDSARIVDSFNGKGVTEEQSGKLDQLAKQLDWEAQQLENVQKAPGGKGPKQ